MKIPSGAPARRGDLQRWVVAGLVVAILDLSFAATYWVIYRGATTLPRLLRSIATGLMGPRAAQGGSAAVTVGALTHCAVAFGWSAFFLLAVRRWPALGRAGAWKTGVPFGVFVWLAMDFVVIPLSRATPTPVTATWFWVCLAWHAVGVGPPIVWICSRRPETGVA